jgi:hypothetical protein
VDDEPKIETLPDGTWSLELPGDGSAHATRLWLQRVANYADVQLGDVQGRIMEFPPPLGWMFIWATEKRGAGKRTDWLPWDEAVKRFGPPKVSRTPTARLPRQ